jgi:hypothetical protein
MVAGFVDLFHLRFLCCMADVVNSGLHDSHHRSTGKLSIDARLPLALSCGSACITVIFRCFVVTCE